MAVCVTGSETIDRPDPQGQPGWWVSDEGQPMHAGPCEPVKVTTIRPARPGDLCEPCAWDVEAAYAVGDMLTCEHHLAETVRAKVR